MPKNLDALRELVKRENIGTLDINGQKLTFQRLMLSDFRELAEWLDRLELDADGKPKNALQCLGLFVEVLARTLVDDETLELDCNDEAGRRYLGQLPPQILVQMGMFALDFSGLSERAVESIKKNLEEKTRGSCSTSAES